MWKVFQWGLVISISVGFIVFVGQRILSAATARTRDASVDALRAKLAAREADDHTTADIPGLNHDVRETPAPDSNDLRALRQRWGRLLSQFDETFQKCMPSAETLHRSYLVRYGLSEGPATDSQKVEAAEYLACFDRVFQELDDLTTGTIPLARILGVYDFSMYAQFLYAFAYLKWAQEIRISILMDAGRPGETVRPIASLLFLQSASQIIRFDADQSRVSWSHFDLWWWEPVKDALRAGLADAAAWDQLDAALAQYARPDHFADQLSELGDAMIEHYTAWPQSIGFEFHEAPLSYSRNWAYKHVTTPLFNHDLTRFCEAMSVLIDLSDEPYHEARPALERFCQEFDLEPSVGETKFIRQNPAWRAIVTIGRHAFERAAYGRAMADTARIAIHLERHHMEHGTYPESLEALKASLGGTLSRNPLDGTPYHYLRTAGFYELGFPDPYWAVELGQTEAEASIVYWAISDTGVASERPSEVIRSEKGETRDAPEPIP